MQTFDRMAPVQPCRRSFDHRELRDCLSTFVTGVAVVTTVCPKNDEPVGLTVNSFSSVSLDPPLILWSLRLQSALYPGFRDAPYFAVNILADDQIDISRRFANAMEDKFSMVETRIGIGGVPLIEGCAAHLECSLEQQFTGGDHVVFLGRVEGIMSRQKPSLAFGGGRYMVTQPHSLA